MKLAALVVALIGLHEYDGQIPNRSREAIAAEIDPMFLGYTLGKLLILQLRADWMAAHPKATLREFHDEFLRYGEAPLSVTRRSMLRANPSSR